MFGLVLRACSVTLVIIVALTQVFFRAKLSLFFHLPLTMMLYTGSDTSSSARHLNLLFNNSTAFTSSLLLQPSLSDSLMKTVQKREGGGILCLMCKLQQSMLQYVSAQIRALAPSENCWQSDEDLKTNGQFHRNCRTPQGLLSAIWGGRQIATLCAQQPWAHWRREIKHKLVLQ